jgi:hypothetical protein
LIEQIVGALAWLEHIGFVHGDLRQAIIYLDGTHATANVRIGGFDAAVRHAVETLKVANEPYCVHNLPAIASAATEQFALASYIYYIRFGHIPFPNLPSPNRVNILRRGIFPEEAKTDLGFGQLMDDCWHGLYFFMDGVQNEVWYIEGKAGISVHDTKSIEDLEALAEIEWAELLRESANFVASKPHPQYDFRLLLPKTQDPKDCDMAPWDPVPL